VFLIHHINVSRIHLSVCMKACGYVDWSPVKVNEVADMVLFCLLLKELLKMFKIIKFFHAILNMYMNIINEILFMILDG